MTYAARVLADSISPVGVRLTTLEVTFPRIVLDNANNAKTPDEMRDWIMSFERARASMLYVLGLPLPPSKEPMR